MRLSELPPSQARDEASPRVRCDAVDDYHADYDTDDLSCYFDELIVLLRRCLLFSSVHDGSEFLSDDALALSHMDDQLVCPGQCLELFR